MKLRNLSILLILVCICAVLGGCGNTQSEDSTEPAAVTDNNTLPQETDNDRDINPDNTDDNKDGTNNSADDDQLDGGNSTPHEDSAETPKSVDNDTPSPAADNDANINPSDTGNAGSGTGDTVDANQLYADISLDGMVADFTSNGCTVIPIINEETDGGSIAAIPIDGNEDKDKNVTVTYNDDCVFQIAVFNVGTGTATLSDASKEDVQNQTSLLLYGDFQDTNHLNVSKVIIEQFQR